jgi:hypothetical protein
VHVHVSRMQLRDFLFICLISLIIVQEMKNDMQLASELACFVVQ